MSPLLRLWHLIRRTRLNDELREELDTHLALIEDEERAEGVSAEQARHRARARFGSPLAYRERVIDAVAIAWFEHACRDLGFAARSLWRHPAFSLSVIITLALAIGATASIFAVVHRVVLNPLPYGDSDQLIALNNGMPSRNIPTFNSLTSELYYQYLDHARTLDGLAIYRTEEQTLTARDMSERIQVTRATPSLAPVLRVRPAYGRWFTDVDGGPSASPVAVLSHRLWATRYGEDASILGAVVIVEGMARQVVGVMPPGFAFPAPGVDAWVPLILTRATASNTYGFAGIGRLRDGIRAEQVRTELDRLGTDLERTAPGGGYDQLVSSATTLLDSTVGRVSMTLWIVFASVGLVLLVACANIANLFLVRSETRLREMAVRRALGAGNGAIARYFLSESLLLSVAGGAAGWALAWQAVNLLIVFEPTNLPRLHEVHLDTVTVAFTLGLALLAGLAFGSLSLLRLPRISVSLRDGGRSLTRGGHLTHRLLMGGQIALALMLLISAGLMLRSVQRLRAVDPGFTPTTALTFRVGLPRTTYETQQQIVTAHRTILARLMVLPGVTGASATTCLPFGQGCNQGGPLFVEGQTLPPDTNPPIVLRRAVAADYFDVMGMRIIRGRGIQTRDVDQDEPVAVVNEAAANAAFPDGNPIDQRIRMGPASSSPEVTNWLTIVGVVTNTPIVSLAEPRPTPQVFMPLFTARQMNLPTRLDAVSYVVQTPLEPVNLVSSARGALAEIDGQLALAQVRSVEELLDRASAQMRFTMALIAIAAAVALILGVVGIYGVMSYVVSRRTSEIGIRLALGAAPHTVVSLILRQGALVAVAGIAGGLAASFVGSRLLSSVLYGVNPRDPEVFAATAILLFGVALFACWLPARRAAQLNPTETLRIE